MFGLAKITTLQFAGDGAGVMRSNVLGLFTSEGQGDSGIRAHIVAVYDELRPLLYSNLVFLGFDPNEADDVIQEAFLGLVRQLGAGRKINDVRGWIFRASYSLSLNVQRQQRKIGLRGADAEVYTHQLPAPGLNPEQQYLFKAQARRYEAAIDRLTSQQRECLLLRKEGLRYREIAVALNVSPSRVPQLLERAVGRLMEEFYG
jgi:RNA polymerase sigma-70 factor (ECF subfamily)